MSTGPQTASSAPIAPAGETSADGASRVAAAAVGTGHEAARAVRRTPAWVARAARSGPLLALASAVAVAAAWELYKVLGPADGWLVGATRMLPRTTDLAMPHTWDMAARLLEPVSGGAGAPPLWSAVLRAGAVSLGVASVGWLLGLVVGMALALAMQRVRLVEAAVLPLVVLSQTVPLIALAPLVRSWGSRLEVGPVQWAPWMSVAVIASYLAFCPVAVGMLRGLQSPTPIHAELMRAYGAGWWSTLVRLRLPASVPYLLPALRLAAAGAVIGAVVAEVATGLPGGLGRMIVEFAAFSASDPAKPWAPIFGAVALGLLAAGLVAALGSSLRRFRRLEVSR